jgi:hypothetical protein
MKRAIGLICAALAAVPALCHAREQVVVVLDAGGGGPRGVVKAIRAHLSDLPVRLVVEELKALPPLFADQLAIARTYAGAHAADKVLWLNAPHNQVFLHFPEPGGERVLVRVVEAKGDTERAEAIAIIVRNFIRASIEAPAPGAAPAALHRAVPRLALSWGYAADFLGAAAPSPHGVFSALSFAVGDRWSIYAGARLHEAAVASAGGARLAVSRYPFEAGIRWRLALDPWHVAFGLGGVLEVLTHDAVVPAGGPAVTPGGDRLLGAGYAGVSAGRALGNSSELFIELGSSFFVNTTEFRQGVDPAAPALLDTWRVRPALRAGLHLGIL